MWQICSPLKADIACTSALRRGDEGSFNIPDSQDSTDPDPRRETTPVRADGFSVVPIFTSMEKTSCLQTILLHLQNLSTST